MKQSLQRAAPAGEPALGRAQARGVRVTQSRTDSGKAHSDRPLPIIEWVENARRGDRQAFHRLMAHFQTEIFRMIYYRTRSRPEAEDLTQDVFLKAFKNIGRLASPELFKSWLYRIALNRVRDHYRRQRVRSLFGFISTDEESIQQNEALSVAPEAPGALERGDFWRRIAHMLNRLPRMEREIFALRFLDQLSISEISSTLKKNESTVKTHLYRALHKVQAMVEDLGGTGGAGTP